MGERRVRELATAGRCCHHGALWHQVGDMLLGRAGAGALSPASTHRHDVLAGVSSSILYWSFLVGQALNTLHVLPWLFFSPMK